MSFSLNQSYEKFSQLRQKLRKLAGNISPQHSNQTKKRQQLPMSPKKQAQKDEALFMQKSKEYIPTRGEQTQRKRKMSKQQSYQMKENVNCNDHLLQKKQQTLNEINKLLQIKKSFLDRIESQIKRQYNKGTSINHQRDKMEQTTKRPKKIKVPNLYQIQQQKRRQRQKICKQRCF